MSVAVRARSRTTTAGGSRLSHWTSVDAPRRRAAGYELTVETSATGIAYDVWAEQRGVDTWYVFAPQATTPARPEPAPDLDRDLHECAGGVRLRWIDDVGLPLPVNSARMEAIRTSDVTPDLQASLRVSRGATEGLLLVRGDGEPFTLRVRYTIGTDPYHDLLTYQMSVRIDVECDEIVTIETRPSSSAASELGTIVGLADVVGEDEHATTEIGSGSGPWGNVRLDSIDGSPASGAWELENLMSTDVESGSVYHPSVMFRFRSGARFEQLQLEAGPTIVEAGTVRDLGGTFVTRPGFVRGDIVLAAPPERVPGDSPLHHVSRTQDPSSDPDGDGVVGHHSIGSYSHVAASLAGRAHASTTFAGDHSAGDAAFLGDYELVAGAPHGMAADWRIGTLELKLRDPVSDDPSRWLDARMTISKALATAHVEPGAVVEDDLRYCMSEVTIAYLTTDGELFDPSFSTIRSGSFDGLDWEGTDVAYQVQTAATGWPTTVGDAAPVGEVRTLLPAARYALRPTIEFVNPGGGTSHVQLRDIDLDVGCRQRLVLRPELGVQLAPAPACAGPGTVTVEGRVYGTQAVSSLSWRIDDGPRTIFRSDCGLNPAFRVDVPVPDADAVITIEAIDADGRASAASAITRRGREPSDLPANPGVPPLLVRREGRELILDWERTGAPASVYRGTIASLAVGRYDHAGMGACGVESGTARVPMTSDAYYLVASSCGWGDGSLGRDSLGGQRPAARDRCR